MHYRLSWGTTNTTDAPEAGRLRSPRSARTGAEVGFVRHAMYDKPRAGEEARTDGDAPTTDKHDDADDEIVTDGGRDFDHDAARVQRSDARRDALAEADDGPTPIEDRFERCRQHIQHGRQPEALGELAEIENRLLGHRQPITGSDDGVTGSYLPPGVVEDDQDDTWTAGQAAAERADDGGEQR